LTSAKVLTTAAWLLLGVSSAAMAAQSAPGANSPVIGPFNGEFLAGGAGFDKPVAPSAAAVQANAPFTLLAWIDGTTPASAPAVLASIGRPDQVEARLLQIEDGRLTFMSGAGRITAKRPLGSGLRLVAVSFDGATLRLFQDGVEVGSGTATLAAVPPPKPKDNWDQQPNTLLELAPLTPDAVANQHFAGRIGGATLYDRALPAAEIARLAGERPDWSLTAWELGSKPWPVQLRQQAGYDAPQDPDTLPHGKAGFSKPHAVAPYAGPALVADSANTWTLKGGWKLAAAPDVKGADGATLSQSGYDASHWYAAVVPGTVLTTLVDRGVYPDPAYGLNNLAIPESLNKQDYWYRTEIEAPAALSGRHTELTFEGVNYAAEVWLNGVRLGDMKGAFVRGRFDVTSLLKPGQKNVLAVRVSPPPHPGIPQEQSIKGGVGENGGLQMLDGPTFVATEGWDWIPGVRDRNTGIWQDVKLSATGSVRIENPQVVTTLPLPDRSRADVSVAVTLDNLSYHAVSGTLNAGFDDVKVQRAVTLAPGRTVVRLTPEEYAQLKVAHPRLWWPNGYGDPALHDLKLDFTADGAVSDTRSLRFGIREITYELSAFDQGGRLQRVEFDPAKSGGRQLIDGDHEHIHKTVNAYAVSMHPGALGTPGLTQLPDDPLSPFLVLKVNGVRIAVRGGAWGMDDFMKRVSRERLEPYFKLNRDAHMNILRNWVGQDTEETLYDLADEYGILVWNDFWESTEDYNLETDDPALFLNNAADVVTRFRNHPSVAIWIGRNEGVPQPYLNSALEKLTRSLDGTRYYAGSSNRVNLQDSGPYNYREPEEYFTKLSHGFAVEVGTPSFSTLESFKASVPAPDQWPLDDVWAYHDWHQSGNGATATFMDSLATKFGAPTGLDDFERKAQMLQYDSYRAIFEGMGAKLWTVNSGRMLWMTQPAWPSNMWQIYSSDYDTAAPYYGTMKASEPVHVQMNLPDFGLSVVNTTLQPLDGLKLHAKVTTLDNQMVVDRTDPVSAAADQTTAAGKLDLASAMAKGPVLVELELDDAAGAPVSRNFYWEAAKPSDLRQLDTLAKAKVGLRVTEATSAGSEHRLKAVLTNTGAAAALQLKLTLQDKDGVRILPAYYADNYVSLLPGETRTVEITYPAASAHGRPQVALRGWNAVPITVGAQ
jgi:hypothetical protein